MANDWFRFKKFTIKQERCAMKVGTDGVLLGAWTNIQEVRRALDIGTGTGLLALMLAQRSSSIRVDAIEIDAEAASQAGQNFNESCFASQIRVINEDFNHFHKQVADKYDLIICNPPYFSRSMKPGTEGRLLARHSEKLTVEQLLSGVRNLLMPDGRLSIILPSDQCEQVIDRALRENLFPVRILSVIPIPGRAPKRTCIEFSMVKMQCKEESLVIEGGGRHQYSDKYIRLTEDFYL